jgi:hypothetical protein
MRLGSICLRHLGEGREMYSFFELIYQGHLVRSIKDAIAIRASSQLMSLYKMGISYSILCRNNRSINVA